ncbi:hypothetical protein LCGC14_1335820 [marine sediment metagenome]|uniref:Zinc finger/thioredoxin putative domain-containing protein n=1 Tax=marine sediment metagenome TaxID=412755 RepID=A0A0F9L197_9ZZZZ
MPTIICTICGYTFTTPLRQFELFTCGKIVRKCPKCDNKMEVNKNGKNV